MTSLDEEGEDDACGSQCGYCGRCSYGPPAKAILSTDLLKVKEVS